MAETQSNAPSCANSGATSSLGSSNTPDSPGSPDTPTYGVIHVRTRLAANFTVISNALAQRRGSAVTIGVAAYILSVPDGARISIAALCAHFDEGEILISRALRELEEAGHLERRRVRGPNGKVRTQTFFYDVPRDAGDRAPRAPQPPTRPAKRRPEPEPEPMPAENNKPTATPASLPPVAPPSPPTPTPPPLPRSASTMPTRRPSSSSPRSVSSTAGSSCPAARSPSWPRRSAGGSRRDSAPRRSPRRSPPACPPPSVPARHAYWRTGCAKPRSRHPRAPSRPPHPCPSPSAGRPATAANGRSGRRGPPRAATAGQPRRPDGSGSR